MTTNSATFTFAGTAGDTARLQCQVDGGSFVDCVSPYTLTGLTDGTHTVAFRAIDAAGSVDPTPAQRTFTVNATVVPPPPPPPPPLTTTTTTVVNSFTLPAHGKESVKKGKLSLSVDLPGPGTLAVQPAHRSQVKSATVTITAAGTAKVTVKLTRKGLGALKKSEHGKLRVKVEVTYTPVGGVPNTEDKTYTLTLKK